MGANRTPAGRGLANRGWWEGQRTKDATGEDIAGTTGGLRYRPMKHQVKGRPGLRRGVTERDSPRRLSGEHPTRYGLRGLSRNVVTRAPAYSMFASFLCEHGRYLLHNRCARDDLVGGAIPAPLRCPAVECRVPNARHGALKVTL